MNDLQLVLFLALPLLVAGRGPLNQKIRCWATLIANSYLSTLSTQVGYFITIDLMAAAIVMSYPSSSWQRLIGLCFVAMGFVSIGTASGQIMSDYIGYSELAYTFFMALSWAQIAILFCWGSYDFYTDRHHRADTRDDVSDNAHRKEYG